MIDTELAKYGPTGVSIALIIGVVYIICKLIPIFKMFVESINANTKVTIEMHTFLKSLNGKLKKAVDEQKRGKNVPT